MVVYLKIKDFIQLLHFIYILVDVMTKNIGRMEATMKITRTFLVAQQIKNLLPTTDEEQLYSFE